jgi:hypothetical protein
LLWIITSSRSKHRADPIEELDKSPTLGWSEHQIAISTPMAGQELDHTGKAFNQGQQTKKGTPLVGILVVWTSPK